MAKYPTLTAAARNEFGKGFARRLRKAGQIPGVIYSKEVEPVHFAVDRLEMTAVVRNHGVNAVVELDVEGEKHLTMVKHVDQNVLTYDIDHIDMLAIKRGERVEVEVPVLVEGEPEAGIMFIQDADVLLVEADVLDIPEELTVNIEGKGIDDMVNAGDVTLPEGVELAGEADDVIVTFSYPVEEEEPETEGEEGESAEGEDSEGDSAEGESSEENSEE